MKAALYEGVKSIKILDKPKPKAASGEVIVKVKYCGICGTDVHSYLHEGIIEPGTVFGHEVVGTIDELGSGVKGWQVGDRIAIGPPGDCGECYNCRQGDSNICANGFNRTVGITPNTDGGYAEYVKVGYPRNMLLKIPENLSYEEAVLYDILGVPFRGIRKSRFGIGDNVVVMGAGAIGLSAILFLKMGGAGQLIVIEPSADRRKLALEFGADLALDPLDKGANLEKEIFDRTAGNGADIVFECAGNPAAINTAIGLTRSGGQLVLIGVGGEPVSIVTARVVPREIEIKTSFVYTGDEINMIFALMAAGKLNAKAMLSDTIALEDVVTKGIDRLSSPGKEIKIVIAPHGV